MTSPTLIPPGYLPEKTRVLLNSLLSNIGIQSVTNTARATKAVTQSIKDWLGFDDISSVVGGKATFWYPIEFGAAATGRIYRFNRVLVGTATLGSSDAPPSVPSCIDAVFPFALQNSQMLSINAIGGLGITGAARSGDFYTAFPANTVGTGGAQGINGYGINDDTHGSAPIAVGLYGFGVHYSGVDGTTMACELEAATAATTVTLTPNSLSGNGGDVIGLVINAGKASFTNNISAFHFYSAYGAARAQKCRIVPVDVLNLSLGAGGGGIVDEFAVGMSTRYLDTSDVVKAEVWGDAAGYHVRGPLDMTYPNATATQIADKTHAANTTNKLAYKPIWDTTNHRLMVTEGSSDVSPWYAADGTAPVTPA
jgi:hypothetical protein